MEEKERNTRISQIMNWNFTYIFWFSRIAHVQRVDGYFECIFHEFWILEEAA